MNIFFFIIFQHPGRLEKYIELFQTLEKMLIHNKFYILPIIYIKPEIDRIFAVRLREIVRRRNAHVIEGEEAATHILYPPCDPLEEEYPRPGMRLKINVIFSNLVMFVLILKLH